MAGCRAEPGCLRCTSAGASACTAGSFLSEAYHAADVLSVAARQVVAPTVLRLWNWFGGVPRRQPYKRALRGSECLAHWPVSRAGHSAATASSPGWRRAPILSLPGKAAGLQRCQRRAQRQGRSRLCEASVGPPAGPSGHPGPSGHAGLSGHACSCHRPPTSSPRRAHVRWDHDGRALHSRPTHFCILLRQQMPRLSPCACGCWGCALHHLDAAQQLCVQWSATSLLLSVLQRALQHAQHTQASTAGRPARCCMLTSRSGWISGIPSSCLGSVQGSVPRKLEMQRLYGWSCNPTAARPGLPKALQQQVCQEPWARRYCL